ncbi:hypothetical protein PFX98_19775 [Paucibacter sediminis]|uniref:Uncharacterized protein n=1 Tax=Paucibacter sediminis TaxID=3019553 RepID=A0AA95SND2_9BURK|nr:hypothetical protein [Paucibacter sp. S2-9]WIT11120.1 hypothetical protein PFX98_19775 [Paucibacter sp. S2-9]
MMQTFQGVIDDAAKICGSQKALAQHLGISPNSITDAKAGRRPLPKEKLAVLACLVDMDPAQLWELQEVANLPRRNPFLQAASAVLSAFLCVVLSVAGNDANAVAIGANAKTQQKPAIHIVELSKAPSPGRAADLGSPRGPFFDLAKPIQPAC